MYDLNSDFPDDLAIHWKHR